MKVTLAKALVVKNRLVQELALLNKKIVESNHVSHQFTKDQEGKIIPKFKNDVNELIKEAGEIRVKLVGTKVAISLANKDRDQQTRIFMLSELKNCIKTLQGLICEPSKEVGGYRTETNVITQKFVQINENTRDAMIKLDQELIDKYQEEMEKYNYNTEIQIPD